MKTPHVFLYVQHLLGIGHLVRSNRIATGLLAAGFDVTLAMGGTAVKNGTFDIVRFPGVIVFLNQGPGTPPRGQFPC